MAPLPLRLLLLINAIATLAAGVVLFAFPGAIPSVVGLTLAPDQAFVAWLGRQVMTWSLTASCPSRMSGWNPNTGGIPPVGLQNWRSASVIG